MTLTTINVDSKTMKAVWYNPSLDGTFPISLEDRPIPTIHLNEVLVKVEATALNHRELPSKSRKANPNVPAFIQGGDAAGTIVELGESVKGWELGDKVVVNPWIENEQRSLGYPLSGLDGTFTQYVKIPVSNIYPIPEHLDYISAASLPIALGTAWRVLMTRGNLEAGQTVFIHGIGGGVALYCLQIAVAKGAKVIVSSGSDEKLNKAIELGAVAGIHYKNENIIDRVKELTEGQGVDLVIDGTGGNTLPISMNIAKEHGKIVNYGGHTGSSFTLEDSWMIFSKQISLIGSSMYSDDEFREALEFVNSKKIRPVVDLVLPLEEFKQGYSYLDEAKQFGKIVFTL